MSGWNCELLPREKKPSRMSWMTACSSSLLLDELHRAGSPRRGAPPTSCASRPNRKKFSAPTSSQISMLAPSTRADGQRAVHLELHVARARGFLARGGDLLRQIRGRIDAAGRCVTLKFGRIHHLDEVAHARIAVDDLGRRGDQPDDELGQVIARRRLAAEDEHARLHRELRIGLQPVIQRRSTCRMFRCWRLYSWMRFTCTSKIASTGRR